MLPENIKKACELAQVPGECKYVVDEKPCCVMGQLYVLEGFDINDLKETSDMFCNIITDNQQLIDKKYGQLRLYDLQCYWDDYPLKTNEELLKKAEYLFKDYENV